MTDKPPTREQEAEKAWDIANKFCGDCRGYLSPDEQLFLCREYKRRVTDASSIGPGLEAAAKQCEEYAASLRAAANPAQRAYAELPAIGADYCAAIVRALAAPSTPAGEQVNAAPQDVCLEQRGPVPALGADPSPVIGHDAPAGAAPHSAAPVQAGEKFPDAPAKSRAERIAWDRVAELTEKIQEMSTPAAQASEPVAWRSEAFYSPDVGSWYEYYDEFREVNDKTGLTPLALAHPTPQAERQGGELLKEARHALAQTFPFDTGAVHRLLTRIDTYLAANGGAR